MSNKDGIEEIIKKVERTEKESKKASTNASVEVKDGVANDSEKKKKTTRQSNLKKKNTTKSSINKKGKVTEKSKESTASDKKVASRTSSEVSPDTKISKKTTVRKSSKKAEKKLSGEKIQVTKEVGITQYDKYLFHEGHSYKCYEFMGAHVVKEGRYKGVRFTTWAPNASKIYLVSNVTDWKIDEKYQLEKISEMGIWSLFTREIKEGDIYKYAIVNNEGTKVVLKSDPYAFYSEHRPNTASIIYKYDSYKWQDEEWLEHKKSCNIYESPVNIYEVHLGSWKVKESGDTYSYTELSKILPKYVKEMGYTHVELMPVMEHPLDDSWGYQITGYFSPTSRYGTPDEFRQLIDEFHKEDIGVILDWVPGHFCKDEHGLYRFDGTPTYEYQDPNRSENKGWGASNFDLGRREVKSFLISNAIYWLEQFHVDGLRVDAVANMLYLDYDRKDGEWTPNKNGGNQNLEAIEFFRELNKEVFRAYPEVLMIAEESTSWPLVTKPSDIGGLGFNFKWNMGWMNDILEYIKLDPINRKWHHNKLTFPMMYNYSENFILPISHDEVVHGKKSLVDKMWGDYWNKFAGLRVFISFMLAHPGKKTLFMGSEFGQFIEWRNKEQLDWHLLEEFEMHQKTHRFFKDINKLYLDNDALWKYDYDGKGFEWIDANNRDQSVLVFMRKADDPKNTLIFICNFTPSVYYNFNIGVPYLGKYEELFNSDNEIYGGSNQLIDEALLSVKSYWHNQKYKLTIKIPPMATLVLKVVDIIDEEKSYFDKDEVKKINYEESMIIAEKEIESKKDN